MKTTVYLIGTVQMSDGEIYKENYKQNGMEDFSDDELVDYAKGIFEDWNNSCYEGEERELLHLEKVTTISHQEDLKL